MDTSHLQPPHQNKDSKDRDSSGYVSDTEKGRNQDSQMVGEMTMSNQHLHVHTDKGNKPQSVSSASNQGDNDIKTPPSSPTNKLLEPKSPTPATMPFTMNPIFPEDLTHHHVQ